MRHSPAMTIETETSDPAAPAEAGTVADKSVDETATAGDPAEEAAGQAPGRPEDEGLKPPEQKPGEIGGPAGPEPTRYGDWEVGGRCSDF